MSNTYGQNNGNRNGNRPNSNGQSNGNRNDNGQSNGNHNDNGQKYTAYNPIARDLPDNYVDEAEKIIRKNHTKITTTKLRNILSMVSDIYNRENISSDEKLNKESMAKLQLLRVRMVYECGRYTSDVKPFIEATKLLDYLLGIGDDRAKFIKYANYVEAIVAYHRFYGGKD